MLQIWKKIRAFEIEERKGFVRIEIVIVDSEIDENDDEFLTIAGNNDSLWYRKLKIGRKLIIGILDYGIYQ